MSYINPDITKILTDGLMKMQNERKDMFKPPIELECYEWLREAYPNIYAEFRAVHDVSE